MSKLFHYLTMSNEVIQTCSNKNQTCFSIKILINSSQMEGNQPQENYKIVLLGNSGVGKTSLINCWLEKNTIDPPHSTIGSCTFEKTIEIDDTKVVLSIWDTAGQEQFQSLTPLYTRSASCAILVASLIDLQSFNQLQTWINLIKESCTKMPPLILAINKMDLESQRMISSDDIEKKYKKTFTYHFYVSAVTGQSVKELFYNAGHLAKKFGKQNSEGMDIKDEKEKGKCC